MQRIYKNLFLLLIGLTFGSSLIAQDLVVQSFNYDSETRDTMISFPTDDHNKWEKIIMLYSMRCKDGLVSPPISGQTNVGCGEWDYSCNTYITDSTQVDSLYRVSPDFSVSNFNEAEFSYSESPTYTYYQSTFKDVNLVNTSNEVVYSVDTADGQSEVLAGANDNLRMQYEWTEESLSAAGLSAGPISAIVLDVTSGSGVYKNFKIRIRNGIDGTNACFSVDDWTEVYYNDLIIDGANNKIVFYQDFMWSGTDDLQVDVSCEIVESDLVLASAQTADNNMTLGQNNAVIDLAGQSRVKLGGDFSSIRNEITLGFWSKGASSLPVNTFLIEGVDTTGNRQINVHLPWSNGQVYWDCGGEGGSYDRINTSVDAEFYRDNWTYWTFTKNAQSGRMIMYRNGVEFLIGNAKNNQIDIDSITIGANASGATPYYGQIDDLKIWNSALTGNEIRSNLCGDFADTDDRLVFHYDFNQNTTDAVMDQSGNGYDGSVVGELTYIQQYPRDFNSYNRAEKVIPIISPVTGDFQLDITDVISLDSVINNQHEVIEYVLDGTDRVINSTNLYYPAGDMPIYDEDGNQVGVKTIAEDGRIIIGTMEHFSKAPMQMELMSFVTPYGINLDLGWEGKTWTFDVTDYGPILKGDKRMFMSRGGQWQEDMDIKFLFYEGTPIRNVNSIKQIWPVTSTGFQNILDDIRFEPREVVRLEEDEEVKVKTVVTGHGQDGEFVPRQHFIGLNGFNFEWSVWKECSANPISPQGGTWVYDRAGWCPGMPSDQQVYDFTGIMQDNVPVTIDYGITAVAGNSNYIVNSQLVKYGAPNFMFDAAIHDVIYPSNKAEYGLFNPNCGEGKIVIQNRGSERLNSAMLVYGFEGGEETSQAWEGNLPFLATEEVILRYIPQLAASTSAEKFYVRIEEFNGIVGQDEYTKNDRMDSDYTPVDMIPSEVVINFRTNNNAQETSYRVYDEFDQVILSKGPGNLTSNTTYLDTLDVLNGCYRLEVNDSGGDGLEWWANASQGAGYLRISNANGGFNTFDPDFGGFLEYNFVAGTVTSVEDIDNYAGSLELFPNPSADRFKVIIDGMTDPQQLQVYDHGGKVIYQKRINGALDNFHEIDLTVYPAGMYIVKVAGKQGSVSRKMIKI